MQKIILLLFVICSFSGAYAQHIFKAQLKDAKTNEPLIGATALLKGTTNGSRTDLNGNVVIRNIPDGNQVIIFRYLGYQEKEHSLVFPLAETTTQIVFLQSEVHVMDEVVVSATRSSRTISDIPTRIETIATSELEEKNTMQPANAKMILTESTGIQTQQTSATSANASIRIQGLDGKYTQLLRDGFPLYSGFAGGLSLVQIPPLDLKRVEVIKGASSTLYGGGAIAGLINFVTKVPIELKELSLLVNGNLSKASDISGFYAQKFDKIGLTVFASQNLQAAYDANKDGLSDLPKIARYTFNPRIFYYLNPSTTLSLGLNTSTENRLGGDMALIRQGADSTHAYFEKNLSTRVSYQLKFEKTFANNCILTFKNSVGYFSRSITKPDYFFAGKQVASFSELSYLFTRRKSEWVLGGNLWTDSFKQTNPSTYLLTNESVTGGIFVQHHFKANERFIVENGLRADVTSRHDFFLLPRVSLLYKISSQFSSRIGGGLGYKTPSIFSEEAEEKGFQQIEPLDFTKVKAENSIGGNIDFNYRTILFDELSCSVNQLFFYTRLHHPLVLSESRLPNGNQAFTNADGFLDSKGFETNVKLTYDDISVYGGYTFIDAIRHFATETANPLTAKHRLYLTCTYEMKEKLRIAYECFYTGAQTLSNGQTRPDYWVMGISVQYNFEHISLFMNAENFTDTRQTRYESIYTGTLQNPKFKEIWAPTDGFLFNAGFKINVW
ncbi:MAG: TonB-dependent receptor plug domain-containing protein [Spirosomataceae bacterium]